MMRQQILSLVLLGCGFLAGCEQTLTITPVATEPDIVTVKLAQAADKAAKALDTIAGIEQVRNPTVPPISNDYKDVPPNLMQPVSLRWAGPVDQVAKVLAERAGYRFREKGNAPASPIVVNVDAYQRPIMHILRDLGLQAGQRADLVVDPTNGVIELRYAPNEAGEVKRDETK